MSTSSPAPASLDSVVAIQKRPLKEWNRLDESKPLAQLRAKFWGKRMPEDEEWRDEQPSTSDSTEDEDDDIKPGCRILDLDNDAIFLKKIWVRAEYIRIYNCLLDFYKEAVTGWHPPAAVITGQPGIGKSVFLYYAVCRCLAEERPFIWKYRCTYYMFAEDGVHELGEHFTAAEYKSVVWTLVDSDESPSGVPEMLVPQNTPFFVINVSSPARERWSRLDKTTLCMVIVMNPWTRNGIHRAASLHPNRPESKTIDAMYDQFGPTPRICIVNPIYNHKLKEHKNDTRIALAGMTLQSLQELTLKMQELNMDRVSEKLCLISREKLHHVGSSFRVTPITAHMQSRLAIHMRNQDTQRLVEMYQVFGRLLPFSKGLSGYLFEIFGHLHFQKRIIIDYAPMVRLTRSDRKNQPKWHSSHPVRDESEPERQDDLELWNLRQDAWRRRATLDVWPEDTHEYGDQEFRESDPRPNIYYIPKATNEEALDTFIWYGDHLFIFQFTVSKEHDIKPGFISRFAACDKFPPPSDWRFIFIVPNDDDEIFKCPYPQSPELRNVKPYYGGLRKADGKITGVGVRRRERASVLQENEIDTRGRVE